MFRIATWNLDRPTIRRTTYARHRLAELERHNADIWILTETDRELALPGYSMIATAPPSHPGYDKREAYAAIHTRWPLKPVPLQTFDPSFGVCAEIDSPLGLLIVYGSIITYHNDGVAEGLKPWKLHRESARQHGNDWLALRKLYPEHTLVVGGDFNQALDGVGRYREREATAILRAAISDAGLRLLTDEDFVRAGKLQSRHSIDHIAISDTGLSNMTFHVDAWEGTTAAGISLSDHNGVAVTLTSSMPDRDLHAPS